jgi:hypothetical protein
MSFEFTADLGALCHGSCGQRTQPPSGDSLNGVSKSGVIAGARGRGNSGGWPYSTVQGSSNSGSRPCFVAIQRSWHTMAWSLFRPLARLGEISQSPRASSQYQVPQERSAPWSRLVVSHPGDHPPGPTMPLRRGSVCVLQGVKHPRLQGDVFQDFRLEAGSLRGT